MFVAASTDCFRDFSFEDAIEKLVDLEFTAVELSIDQSGNQIRPTDIRDDLNAAFVQCSSTRRMNVSGYSLVIDAQGDEFLDLFTACCKLAKAAKVVSVTVPSGEHGTPFNEEVEKLKQLVKIGQQHGVRVGVRSQVKHLSEDPDTVSVICGHVKGLGLSLDPSHYVYQNDRPANYEKLLEYVQTVFLRDSTKNDLQVRVGQGVIDFGKLINQLRKIGYNRALVVDIPPKDGVDHLGEIRKMRLLLESLLLG